MSALTEQVAREHHLVYVPEVMARHCSCGQKPGPYVGGQWHPYHVAQVTEAATRAAVAAEIRAATIQFDNSGCTPGMDYLLSEAYDKGLRVAARISEGKQP